MYCPKLSKAPYETPKQDGRTGQGGEFFKSEASWKSDAWKKKFPKMDVLPGYGRYGIFTCIWGWKNEHSIPNGVVFHGDLPWVTKGNTSP